MAFYGCDSLTDVVLPKHLREIGRAAFVDCRQLKTINIPDSVTHIGDCAFSNCRQLATVRLPQNFQLNIDNHAFSECPSLFQVQLPMLMSRQQQIAIIDQINEDNHPSFQHVGLNNLGQRTFFGDVPILLLPHLFEYSPRSHLWRVFNHLTTNNSTRMSVLFCHLRDNMADMLEMRIKQCQYQPASIQSNPI